MIVDRRYRAEREARIHREGDVRGIHELANRDGEKHRQALAAEFDRRRCSNPTARNQFVVGVLETWGRRDGAVGVVLAAFLVADAVKRRQHILAELRGLTEHCRGHDPASRRQTPEDCCSARREARR